MSLVMEDFKPSVSTLEEVKKLQDLVRKLEIQNLHLRNKQITNRRQSDSCVKERRASPTSRSHKRPSEESATHDSHACVENTCFLNKDEYFDELEIIRVSDIEMSDDESWLYTSPKSIMNERRESSYKWLRKDVDDLENKQLQLAKKALLTKLNELEILSPNKLNNHLMGNNAVTNLHRSQDFCKTSLLNQNFDSGSVDTRTFTRSKKKQALDFLEKLDLINNGRNNEKYHSSESSIRLGSDLSSDSLLTCHVLEDANDVQEVARMQEESLRMSSPMSISKRGSLSSTYRRISSSRGSVSDQDVSETSVFSAHSADDNEHDLFENETYLMDPSHHSNHSSSSESPYGSNISLHNSGKNAAKLSRCSLPNLTRDPVIVRQLKSKTHKESRLLQSNQTKGQSVGRKSDTSLETLHKNHRQDYISPSRQRRSPNQVPRRGQRNFVSYPNSEPNTNVPRSAESVDYRHQPKSGLPRPSRANSASRSNVRSGIPTPSMQSKKRLEDTWSEGCF